MSPVAGAVGWFGVYVMEWHFDIWTKEPSFTSKQKTTNHSGVWIISILNERSSSSSTIISANTTTCILRNKAIDVTKRVVFFCFFFFFWGGGVSRKFVWVNQTVKCICNQKLAIPLPANIPAFNAIRPSLDYQIRCDSFTDSFANDDCEYFSMITRQCPHGSTRYARGHSTSSADHVRSDKYTSWRFYEYIVASVTLSTQNRHSSWHRYGTCEFIFTTANLLLD